ncbi:MAG TPA: M1 family aminopeptidase [Acidimicrobiales bacterium]|nr:M1 family aminopeptidase [Acidimicrobiales bacterium]
MPRRPFAVFALLALSLVACGDRSPDVGARIVRPTTSTAPESPSPTGGPAVVTDAAQPPTTTAASPPPGSGPKPSSATSVTAGAAVAPAPSRAALACPATPPRAGARPDRTRYELHVDVRTAENAVVGDLVARFTPDRATDRLVFRLWPNGPRLARFGARLDTGAVTVDGREVASERTAPTVLEVRTGAIAAGRTVEVAMPWRLTLPNIVNDRIYRKGDILRLGSFFPILPWEPGLGWTIEPPTTAFAEASMAPVADFVVHVKLPPGLTAITSGTDAGGGRFVARSMRDFAMSVGRFRITGGTAQAPHTVKITVGVAGASDDPGVYLRKAQRVLADFSRRYGDYPWDSFTIAVTPELSGGIEYPSHVMHGPGTTGRVLSHEVGHMWFYGLVGNNQGRDPWLDEGLATWAEDRFEGTTTATRNKSVPAGGRGRAGEPMTYWESRQDIYYRSVYTQGAQALGALGPADRVDCALAHYVAHNANRVARNRDIVEALRPSFPDVESVFARYGIRA